MLAGHGLTKLIDISCSPMLLVGCSQPNGAAMIIAELSIATDGNATLVKAVVYDDIEKSLGDTVGPIKYDGEESLRKLAAMIQRRYRHQVPSINGLINELKLNHNVNTLNKTNIFNQPYPLIYDHTTCRYLSENDNQATISILKMT